MLPNRYVFPDKPAIAKKSRAFLNHISPPIKGLADDARSAESDQKFAGVLVNLYPEDDRITARAGFAEVSTVAGGHAIEHLVPYYGQPERLASAANNSFYDADTATLLRGGFNSNDWHWTSFSNLGQPEYTVMVNGEDGVWSWDGQSVPNETVMSVSKITGANPAVVSVVDASTLQSGDAVIITGANPAHAAANGPQRIANVNTTTDTFELVGVNLTAAGGDQTTGTMTVQAQHSFVREAVIAPTGNTWLQPNQLAMVVAHQNRLFFADESNLAVYYLPLQQKYGALEVLPLNAIFKKGGTIKALATWTVDGGMGMDDQLVIFTTNGEVAIYSGVDPSDDFTLVGVYRFDPVASKWSVLNYGGELYVLLPSGLTAMSTVIKSGREGVEAADKTVVSRFLKMTIAHRGRAGWELFLNPNSGRIFCNIPQGGGRYNQMIRAMAKPVWSEFRDIPARCWGWVEPYVYFADDKGKVYRMHPSIQNDNGKPIYIDVQTAWSQFKTPTIKHFKMILPYILTDGFPVPQIDLKVDFDQSPPFNEPDITGADPQTATWDEAVWDVDYWVAGTHNWDNWTGVASLGRVGAVRMTAAIFNCSFSCTGFDVLYEKGSVFG